MVHEVQIAVTTALAQWVSSPKSAVQLTLWTILDKLLVANRMDQ